ncbi:polymer-forming cytoskeletal protein [Clostridium tagluense]|uniref:Cell shape determination protein CcmA n=1 Tax=Clostridium tagluense TaxID=360422 RepID=A0A401UJS3_9CLOT|nr:MULTISPECIES: polymer-forming cytoskeletal protein [Clostridium]MBW9157066.1 polymer-forming cytoskeletal protein [Clostridium tagluense]MBZ9625250.1 polymer-forming cytoskeletal protein [Clostridium sp. FP2]MCB2296704.1 polymer-forming cytoskeletal protein [Clostridium tagluense]MCB2311088.1 polymer-forming cytoskeletal protein [Clostridium tagluense]MCB2318365.1 polymer-forming cytoskeletal protein [Clostridium tagluense]
MFNNKEKDVNRIETLIGDQCFIIGSLNVNGLIKIDGSIDGDIFCADDVILGESGHIKGNTVCDNASINGMINGNICCKSTLSIESCGKVKGDISVKKLMISEGGILDGKCTMIGYEDPNSENNNL